MTNQINTLRIVLDNIRNIRKNIQETSNFMKIENILISKIDHEK